MAFVFKQKKNIDFTRPNSAFLPGPGQYLAQTQKRKININNAPFNVKAQRDVNKIDTNPGPGTYYTDRLIDKIQKMEVEGTEKINNQNDMMRQIALFPMYKEEDLPEKYKYKYNKEKDFFGFEVKDKRFKEKINTNPGPGTYFNNKRSFSANTNKYTNNLRSKHNLRKNNLSAIYENRKICPPSIPNASTEYIVHFDDTLTIKEDEYKYKKFTGIGDNQVGPGSYELDNPKYWDKSIPQWSKMKSKRIDDNRNAISAKTNKSELETRPNTALLDMRVVPCNKKIKHENYAKVVSAQRVKRFNNFKYIQEELKSQNKKYKNNLSTNQLLVNKAYDNFMNFTKKITPGPGYYLDINKNSAFNPTYCPENYQFFGSNRDRFTDNKTNPELGPTSYFKDICQTQKVKKNNAPFSAHSKRFKYQSKKQKDEITPGPGAYNPKLDNEIEKNHFNEKMTTFYSRTKRFDENNNNIKDNLNTPGPGSYINPYSGIGFSDTVNYNGFYINNRTKKEWLRNLSKPKKQLKIMHKIKSFIPPVGEYDPEKIYTIEYNVNKYVNNFGGKNIAFNTHKPPKRKIVKSNVGPGLYYKEKSNDIKQNSKPFNSGDIRLKCEDRLDIGPGQYDSRSFFDWNKKSFNVTYI